MPKIPGPTQPAHTGGTIIMVQHGNNEQLTFEVKGGKVVIKVQPSDGEFEHFSSLAMDLPLMSFR